jgi:ADP-ribosyl-[dinitrogen reductase] hydrolase
MAVNLGDDDDTTGAAHDQVAGALYGASGIPGEWPARLALREQIGGIAEELVRR